MQKKCSKKLLVNVVKWTESNMIVQNDSQMMVVIRLIEVKLVVQCIYPFRWVPTRALDSVKPFRTVWVGVFAACYPGRWCLLLACFKNVHCSLWFLRRCVKFGLCSISSIAKKSAVVIHLLLYTVYCIICVSICLGQMKTLWPYMQNDQVVWSQSVFFFSPGFWYASNFTCEDLVSPPEI